MANFITAEQAALLIPSGAHVAALGSGGGVLEPDLIYKALESRFDENKLEVSPAPKTMAEQNAELARLERSSGIEPSISE